MTPTFCRPDGAHELQVFLFPLAPLRPDVRRGRAGFRLLGVALLVELGQFRALDALLQRVEDLPLASGATFAHPGVAP